jgi:hypothetical protein
MRLLECQSDGAFRLTRRIADDDIPRHPYAILSHTWGPESEEVIFEDLAGGSAKDKAGYRKIQFCGELLHLLPATKRYTRANPVHRSATSDEAERHDNGLSAFQHLSSISLVVQQVRFGFLQKQYNTE